jgi:hypothetical protein
MQPRIDRTQFGSITIDGKVFEHDVLIRLGGQVEKRKKKLSKAVYGTSHTVSLPRPSMSTRRAARLLTVLASTAGSRCRRRRPATSSATAARWSCRRRRR